ncbi:MAG: hypothetical protein P1R58_06175 [bacterium]|nr:hypothetical protein [bacterium]
MVSIIDLWLPILVSSVFVFVLSSLLHMLLKYHQSDFSGLPEETKVLEALRPFKIPPGDYYFPHAEGMEACKSPEYIEKATNGPVGMMTICENGPPTMGGALIGWFCYSIVVSIFAAYLSSRAVGPGGYYLEVFRFAGCTAFVGYSLALLQNSIWYKRKWSSTLKSMFDGLLYALVTAGTFGWLWPGL